MSDGSDLKNCDFMRSNVLNSQSNNQLSVLSGPNDCWPEKFVPEDSWSVKDIVGREVIYVLFYK